MQRFICVLIVLASPLLLTAGGDDAGKELKALQGTWKAIGIEASGMKFPKEAVPDFRFIVGDDGKAIGKMAKSEYQAMVTVDPKKKPKTIENVHETGPSKGKKQFGIYKMEKDKWIVCMTAPGAMESDRPTSFETKGTKNVVFTFERIKADKKP